MNFFAELITRLFSKSPWFFRVIKGILLVVALITGAPSLFEQIGIVLPPKMQIIENKTVAVAALVAMFISQLTKVEPETHPSDVKEKIKQLEIKSEEDKI